MVSTEGSVMSQSGVFVIGGAEKETCTPADYGRWAARWGFDIAKGEIKDLANSKFQAFPAISAIRENVLPFLVHSAGLWTAAYSAYAMCVLGNVPTQNVNAIKQGIVVGMGEWLMTLEGLPSAARVTMIETFNAIHDEYLKVLVTDYIELSSRDPDVFCPDAGKADGIFLDFLVQVYWNGKQPSMAERSVFDFLNITDMVIALYKGNATQIGISYIP